jgi:DNA-binding GntR family transcriptional regulator
VSLRVFRTFRPDDFSHTMVHHPELVAALAAKDAEWAAAVASAHVRASRHVAILALRRSRDGH